MAWQHVLPDESDESIEKIAPLPNAPGQFAVLTSKAVWLLNRSVAEYSSDPRKVSGDAARDLAVSNGGLYWIEEKDREAAGQKATHLCFLPAPYDEDSRVEIVGEAMPAQAATYSVAVDPRTHDVLRSDTEGQVARYDWRSHCWVPEDVGNQRGTGVDLFTLGDTVWAWSSSHDQLFRRDEEGAWKPFRYEATETKVTQVVRDPEGMLLCVQAGPVLYADANGNPREIIPSESQGPEADWQDGALAELGDWLLVSDSKCLRAYHRKLHSWKNILSVPVHSFELISSSNGRQYFYAKNHDSGRIWCIAEEGGELSANAIVFPAATPADASDQPASGAPAEQSPVLADEGHGKPPTSRLAPIGAMIISVLLAFVCGAFFWRKRPGWWARLAAVLCIVFLCLTGFCALELFAPFFAGPGGGKSGQRRGAELLSLESADGTQLLARSPGGAVYELRDGRVAGAPLVRPVPWQESKLPQVSAATEWCELLLLGYRTDRERSGVAIYDPRQLTWQKVDLDAHSVRQFWPLGSRLFVQVQRRPPGGSGPTDALVELTVDAAGIWSGRRCVEQLYDVASDGTHLWFVDAKQRVRAHRPDEDVQDVEALGADAAPRSIRSIVPIGDELVALLDDGTVWQYSLTQLCWQRTLQGDRFVGLFLANGNLVAVEARRCWHYVDAQERRKWVQLERAATGAVLMPGSPRDTSRDQWQVTKLGTEWRFGWRCEKESDFRYVSLSNDPADARFDFNRFVQIEWQNDELWCETLASGPQGRIHRRFATGAKGIERELDVGAARFEIAAKSASEAFQERSPFEVDGEWFAVDASDDGPWSLLSHAGGLRVKLKQVAGDAFPVAPVQIDDGWSLDIDDWAEVVSFRGLLHAATQAGVLSVDIRGGDGNIRRVAFQPCTTPIRFVRREDELYARAGGGALYQFHADTTSWREVVDPKLKQSLQSKETVVRSNRYLRNWRIVGRDPFDLQMKVGTSSESGDDFVTVSLDGRGFGFDRVIGIALDQHQMVFYGPDGRVCYSRASSDGVPIQLDPKYRLRDEDDRTARYLAAQHPKYGLVLLGKEDGYRFTDGTWDPLSRDRLLDVREDLRETLHARHGWEWKSDDSVTVTLPPFSIDYPLEGWFDPRSGQFSFDRLFALHTRGDELMAASGSGVITWRDNTLVAVDPATKFDKDEPTSGRFFRDVKGAWLLHLDFDTTAPDSGDRLFRHQAAWHEVESQRVESTLAQHAARLLSGTRWKLSVTDQLHIERQFGSREMAPVQFSERQWTFEDVKTVCSADGRIVCGTAAGLLDLRGPQLCTEKNAVRRMALEEDRLHVELADGEEHWYASTNLKKLQDYQGTPFDDPDRTLYEDDRWSWRRIGASGPSEGQGSVEIRVSLIPNEEKKRITDFAKGRFDFDRVQDVGCDGQNVVLATAAGILVRAPHSQGTHLETPDITLPKSAYIDVFSVWHRGARKLFVEAPYEVFCKADKWSKLPVEDAAEALRLRDEQVTCNHRWNVMKPQQQLKFRLSSGSQENQLVEFDSGAGVFSFDLVNDVLLGPDGQRLFVATQGGLLQYGLDGTLEELRSDFERNNSPTQISELERTAEGPIALSSFGNAYRWDANSWENTDAAEAQRAIDEHRRRIHDDADGWRVKRVSTTNRVEDFKFAWANQSLHLDETSGSLAFTHDLAVSADWHSDCAWVATRGGVLRLSWEDGQLIAPESGVHLWTEPFLKHVPFQIREVPVREKPSVKTIVCRTESSDGNERPFAFAPTKDVQSPWRPVSADKRFGVLHADDGFWEWRLEPSGGVRITPNRDVFTLPNSGNYEYFHGGQIAFWDVPAEESAQDPLAFRDRLFLATAGGVVRFSSGQDQMERVYAADADGEPLLNVTDLGTDLQNPNELYARSGSQVYHYESADDGWKPVQQPFPGRRQTVNCAWLTFQHSEAEPPQLRFLPGISDLPELPVEGYLLAGGRFTFDQVEDFVWRKGDGDGDDGCYWLLTPIGIVRLNPRDGAIRHFAASFGSDYSSLVSLHLKNETDRDAMYICDGKSQVWKEEGRGKWAVDRSGEATYEHLRTVARNAMLTCRRLKDRRYAFEMGDFAANLPAFHNEPQTPMLLKGGVFLFDDLRDVRMVDDQLLVAARDGVWEYDLKAIRDLVEPDLIEERRESLARIPTHAVFDTRDSASETDERLALTDLDCFASTPSDNVIRLFAGDPEVEFNRRDDGTWEACRRTPLRRGTHLDLPDKDRHVTWRISLGHTKEHDVLTVQRRQNDAPTISADYELPPPGNATVDRFDVIDTESSIWIALPKGLLWVRKDEFMERWWASRGG